MLGSRSRPRIPLPKQWSKRVRSGVLHAISLAHFSVTFTRSWAANGFNARIRLKAENDRPRQELALLRKEMRIKDARMLRIPAQRRLGVCRSSWTILAKRRYGSRLVTCALPSVNRNRGEASHTPAPSLSIPSVNR
jgi:hypothetical protein